MRGNGFETIAFCEFQGTYSRFKTQTGLRICLAELDPAGAAQWPMMVVAIRYVFPTDLPVDGLEIAAMEEMILQAVDPPKSISTVFACNGFK